MNKKYIILQEENKNNEIMYYEKIEEFKRESENNILKHSSVIENKKNELENLVTELKMHNESLNKKYKDLQLNFENESKDNSRQKALVNVLTNQKKLIINILVKKTKIFKENIMKFTNILREEKKLNKRNIYQ